MNKQLLSGKYILYVEDDDFLADLIGRKLGLEGALVVHAGSAHLAFEKMETETFDLLLLDILLPGMTGLQFLEEMNKKYDLTKIPVVAFSNLSLPEDIKRAKELGVDTYLVKAHVSPDEIARALKEVIEKNQ